MSIEGEDQQLASRVESKPETGKRIPLAKVYAAVGKIVSVLAIDPRGRFLSVFDIETAILPALVANQFMIARNVAGALRS